MGAAAKLKRFLRSGLPGISILPQWQTTWWFSAPTFTLNGQRYSGFCHSYNCGWPPSRMTERTVELALADHWLEHAQGPVVEVGAVTPYYWPGRVSRIVDPWDSHPRVTDRISLFDLDFVGADVLCLSTLEHVGTGEYGAPAEAKGPIQAFLHLTKACRDYLISMPFGLHPDIDATIFSDHPPEPARYLVRSVEGNDWHECSVHEARVPLKQKGPSRNAFSWANGLAILSRGGGM